MEDWTSDSSSAAVMDFHGFGGMEDRLCGDIDGKPVEGLGLEIGEGVEDGSGGEHEGPCF